MNPSRPQNPLFPLTRPLRRGLALLRARVRALLMLLGSARTVSTLVAGFALLFVLDYYLRVPAVVRGVLLAGLVAGLGYTILRHLVHPLGDSLSDGDLAEHVEAAFPELEDRLASSISFGSRTLDPHNEDSPALMQAVIEETVHVARDLPFGSVARSRKVVPSMVLAAVALVGAVIGVQQEPGLFRIFVARDLLLRDAAWPRRTTLSVEVQGKELVPGRPLRVTRGRDVTIDVTADGSIPDEVEFQFWELQRGRDRAERFDLNPSPEQRGRFSLSLPVRTSLAFTVAGGDDDRREIYMLEALTPPAVLGVTMLCQYPPYLGRDAETLEGGDQRLPTGTKVQLRIRVNMDLKRASLVLGSEQPARLERIEDQADVYGHELEVREDLRYSVRLEGVHGERNDPAVDTFFLRAVRDQAPVLRIHTPSARVDRTSRGVLLVRFEAHDDYRITDTELIYKIGDQESRTLKLGAARRDGAHLAQAQPAQAARVWGLAVLDFSLLQQADGRPLARGTDFEYRLRVTDSAGKVTETPARGVNLVAEKEIVRGVEGHQQTLFDRVDRARRKSQEAEALLRSLNDAFAEDGGGALLWARRARSAEGRVGQDMQRIASRVSNILNDYTFNRLDDPSAADQMLPFYERHLLDADGGPVPFRDTLYRDLWSAVQERAIRVGGSPHKLLQMAALSHYLAGDVAPVVYQALDQLTLGPQPAEARRLLEIAVDKHKELADGLRTLTRLLREWRTYEGVVQTFKLILEIQSDVRDELLDLDQGD